MEHLKTYEGFFDWLRGKKEEESQEEVVVKEFPSKEELIDMINTTGAYLKSQRFARGSHWRPIKAIRYNDKTDKFLLIYQGHVSKIHYTYDDLILYAKEFNGIIEDNSLNEEIGFGGVPNMRSPWTNRSRGRRSSGSGSDGGERYVHDPLRYFRDIEIKDDIVEFKHYPRNQFNIEISKLDKTKEELEQMEEKELKELLKSKSREWYWDTSDKPNIHDSYDVHHQNYKDFYKVGTVGTIEEACELVRQKMDEFKWNWSLINTYDTLTIGKRGEGKNKYAGLLDITYGGGSFMIISREGYLEEMDERIEKRKREKGEKSKSNTRSFWDFLKGK